MHKAFNFGRPRFPSKFGDFPSQNQFFSHFYFYYFPANPFLPRVPCSLRGDQAEDAEDQRDPKVQERGELLQVRERRKKYFPSKIFQLKLQNFAA